MNHNYSSGINASFKLSWCQGNLPLTLELCNSVILARCLQDCLYPLCDNYLLRCGDNYNDAAPTIIWAIKLFSVGSGNNCLRIIICICRGNKQCFYTQPDWLLVVQKWLASTIHLQAAKETKVHIKDFTSGHFFGILIDQIWLCSCHIMSFNRGLFYYWWIRTLKIPLQTWTSFTKVRDWQNKS